MPDQKLKIVFSGGGSMGHVTPNLVIYRELRTLAQQQKKGVEVLYIGRHDDMERQAVEAQGVQFQSILSGKFRRYMHWRHLLDPFLVFIGFFQSLYILFRFRPQFVFLKGGYVTVPVAVAAKVLRIPMMAHESDSVVGLANKIVARLGAQLALGFPPDVYPAVPEKSFFSGNPVRLELTENIMSRETLDRQYGFYRNRPMILVIGGSQGSQRINTLMGAILPKLLDDYVVVHSTGMKGYDSFEEMRNELHPGQRDNYFVAPYIHETLGNFLAHADLVISRAGAGAISEILKFKKPAIFIPLTASAGGVQQIRNADFLKKHKIASVLDESHITSEKLLDEIEFVLQDSAAREELMHDIEKIMPENSGRLIAEKILERATAQEE